MNWLVLTKQEQAAALFLTGTLLMGCLVLTADAVRKEGLPGFRVIPGAVEPPRGPDADKAMSEPIAPARAGVSEPATSPAQGPETTTSVNDADRSLLEALPGIGPRTAAAIIEYRRRHGRFESIDELMQVRGIGPRTFARLRPLLRLD